MKFAIVVLIAFVSFYTSMGVSTGNEQDKQDEVDDYYDYDDYCESDAGNFVSYAIIYHLWLLNSKRLSKTLRKVCMAFVFQIQTL